ncbi:MAG: TonB-dependent receptor plug domain-containing protein, partial [Planctomycetes bacterium]|nr:TonB-dependent receptor plug domain-containing protein [Planctomycetota bacterium]
SEIEKPGARDLMDIINLIPGFRFAGEVVEFVGLSSRGIWAAEGKILVLLDGVEMNETLYGYVPYGNHIPAEMIEQIEIIRGPGSAMYGGNSEMAVIKITSRNIDKKGTEVFVHGTLSTNDGELSYRRTGGLYHKSDDWNVSLFTSGFRGNRSNEMQEGIYGASYDMSSDSEISPELVNIGCNYKDLNVRYIYDRYEYKMRNYYSIKSDLREERFNSELLLVDYDFKIKDIWTLVPKFTMKKHPTWQNWGDVVRYNTVGTRFTYNLTNKVKLKNDSLLVFGYEMYDDKGEALDQATNSQPEGKYYFDNSNKVSHRNQSLFVQYETETKYGDLALGARYEDHSFAGEDFVPRFALTRLWDSFHLKLLAAQAFRTPNIDNIMYNEDLVKAGSADTLVSEKTTTFEIEGGYLFSEKIMWTSNFFHVTIDDPIYYTYDGDGNGGYDNGEAVSSFGLETELRVVPSWGDLKLRYGTYIADKQGVPTWRPGDDDDQNVGLPHHQIALDVTYNTSSRSSLNLNGFITTKSKSYGGKGDSTLVDFDGETILNIYWQYTHKKFKGGIGISDLLNTKEFIKPAYLSYQSGIPQMGREFYLRLGLTF